MSAFLIVMAIPNTQVAIKTKEIYTATAGSIIAKHGGKPIIRSTNITVLTGNPVNMVMVVEFPDRVTAIAFWDDPEYVALTDLRVQVFSDLYMYIID